MCTWSSVLVLLHYIVFTSKFSHWVIFLVWSFLMTRFCSSLCSAVVHAVHCSCHVSLPQVSGDVRTGVVHWPPDLPVYQHTPPPSPSAWMGICPMFPSPLSLGLQASPTVSGTELTFCRSGGWFLALGFICGLPRYSAMFGFVFFFLWLFPRPSSPPVSVLNQLPLPSPLPATTTKSLLYNGRIAEEVTCLLGCRDENLASQLAHGLNQVSTEHMWVSPTFLINNIEVKQNSYRLKIMFRSRGTLCVVQNTFN